MKKLILSIAAVLLFNNCAQAACDYINKCSPTAYGNVSPSWQKVSKYTGATFYAEQIANSIIRKELKKATKEKFRVQIKSCSAKDLLQGRFKSLQISGKNLEMENTYITLFELKTLCDFNYVEFGKDYIKFKENMVLDFTMEISDFDLRRTMKSTGYLEKLNSTNICAMGMTFLKLENADVKIKNNKLFFTLKVSSKLLPMPVEVILKADLKVDGGRIILTKIDFVNLSAGMNLSKAAHLLNTLNPLTFSTDILENKNSKLFVRTVSIIGDKIVINGLIFIPKNTK